MPSRLLFAHFRQIHTNSRFGLSRLFQKRLDGLKSKSLLDLFQQPRFGPIILLFPWVLNPLMGDGQVSIKAINIHDDFRS